jgi:hypothetical protein
VSNVKVQAVKDAIEGDFSAVSGTGYVGIVRNYTDFAVMISQINNYTQPNGELYVSGTDATNTVNMSGTVQIPDGRTVTLLPLSGTQTLKRVSGNTGALLSVVAGGTLKLGKSGMSDSLVIDGGETWSGGTAAAGGTLTSALGATYPAITVSGVGANLYMQHANVTIQNNNNTYNANINNQLGGGVNVALGGNFTLSAGTIKQNTSFLGGGVMVFAGSGTSILMGSNTLFTMSGGVVESNLASYTDSYGGGGIFLIGNSNSGSGNPTATFAMTAGTVQSNKSAYAGSTGGGVFSQGTYAIKSINGTVSNNVPSQYN